MRKVNDFKVEITKLSQEDGGGYIAKIPQLGCIGDGDTQATAIQDVLSVAEEFIILANENGDKIPSPDLYSDKENFSGKLSLRLPKYLHQKIAELSKEENCSINQLITSYIAIGVGREYEKHINIKVEYNNQLMSNNEFSAFNQEIWDKSKGNFNNIMYA
ncbi:hypothetical protein AN1V17_04940 [Vallitalea sediminicola]